MIRVTTLVKLSLLFVTNAVGTFHNPYVTYRRLSVEKTDHRHFLFVFLLVIAYFIFASFIRIGKSYPFLLSVHFNVLFAAFIFGFTTMIVFFITLGKLLGGKGSVKTLTILWTYSLLPTTIWFFLTSLLYIFLPPPRTEAFLGKLFSVIFLTLTLSLFFWKIILYYLTLRFALRLDLLKIGLITLLVVPLIVGLSTVFYMLRIFRVPFL
ncbi:hypothetical protein HYW55_05845 [Candidatus Gottesmanbacteria bacterium]|nr:hypothetical protein [Candidatus Gottesmanbacteria bacterium]